MTVKHKHGSTGVTQSAQPMTDRLREDASLEGASEWPGLESHESESWTLEASIDGNLAMAEVAVVGAGAAAVSSLLNWQRGEAASRPRMLWIAPAEANGAGVAYASHDPQHRLNVRARRMSAIEDLPNDFVDFLRARDGDADPDAFYPRADYAAYLHLRLQALLQEPGFEHWPTTAIGAHRVNGSWQIAGANGRIRHAQTLVLAAGTLPTRCLRGVATELREDGRYQVDPWHFARHPPALARRPDIWIVGTGLTAVDMALTAARQYPDARIHLLSRHGSLPAVQTHPAALSAADGAALVARLENESRLSRWLCEVRRAMAQCADWRSVMECLRPVTVSLWRGLGRVERARFLRHLRWAWDSARHRMAPAVNEQLRELMSTGRLQIHAGRMLSVRAADANGVVMAYQPRGSEITRLQRAELVIQACGLENRASAESPGLIGDLLSCGHVRPDPLGLGLDVDGENAAVDQYGRTADDLWVIGALAQGSLWESTAMPDIRLHAARAISAVQTRPQILEALARANSRRSLQKHFVGGFSGY